MLMLECRLQCRHCALDSLVVQSLVLILQNKRQSVRLFALRQLVTLVNIEQRNALKQLLLSCKGCCSQLRERYALINEECQVAFNLRVLRQLNG